jgi:hypothetical protein
MSISGYKIGATFSARRFPMSAGDQVRSKIRTVETAISDAKTPNALQAVVVTLKEIADALDEVERRTRRVVQDQL